MEISTNDLKKVNGDKDLRAGQGDVGDWNWEKEALSRA